MHAQVETSTAHVTKIYCNAKVYEVTDTAIIDGHTKIETATGHLEELCELCNRLKEFRSIFETPKIHAALKKLATHDFCKKYAHNEGLNTIEETVYNETLAYGGLFVQNNEGLGSVNVVGRPESIVKLCKSHHDVEEILRIAHKWRSQGLTPIALAIADLDKQNKNILKRGVKEKMTMVGLLCVSEQ
jgi:magnesium-transporting ATPase (P-type)